EFWSVFDSYKGLRGVVHSFSAHPGQLDQILTRGLYVGLNGIMTFTDDELQLSAAGMVPKDKLVLETDAPFLTPAPDRGQLCEPKHIRHIAQFLADLRGESVEELASYTTKNARELFGI
ncbi:MAG TPA: TatD family hydrolase, partial [Candidatus Saccharimonadales bacterium]|nr:TatD family hydrolase [Candidatus Saccharimonadales bacterium]